MEGREHISEKILTTMMNYNVDFVNKTIESSTKRLFYLVDKLLPRGYRVNKVNKIVNERNGALLTLHFLDFRTLSGMSTMSTKKIVKVYVGTYI